MKLLESIRLNKLISGIDEAGRGSIFGPLVIVGLSLSTSDLKLLQKQGLKDSKLFVGSLGRKKREDLANKILETCEKPIIKLIPSKQIDDALARKPHDNLNLLEIRYFYEILKELETNETSIDNIHSPKYTIDQLRNLMVTNKDSSKLIIHSRKDDEYIVS